MQNETAKENLLRQIREYRPYNEQEERDRAILLKWMESGCDILTRENETAHLTASAWVVSPDRKQVLMAYHNIYHSWAWLGGPRGRRCGSLQRGGKRSEGGIRD